MSYRFVLQLGVVGFVKRLAIVALWCVGGAGVVLVAFVFSFYTAMRLQMQSTEVAVPALGGMTLIEAQEELVALGLVPVVTDERNDPRTPSGRVLEQAPMTGASVRRGRKVKLVMSLGGRVLHVPDLLGQADRAVTIELRREGFVAGDEAHVFAHDVDPGRILAQVPPPEAAAVPNTRIHRLVSEGAPIPTYVMPDLTGRPRAEAERWISASGFRRGVVRRVPGGGRPAGSVVAQTPLAGYPIRANEIVELAIAE